MIRQNRPQSGHIPRKRFGQHFLTDQGVLQRIAGAAAPPGCHNLVEIGPGLGALTDALLQRVSRLTAIELDRDLAARLTDRYSPEQLTVLQMDVLQCQFSEIKREQPDHPFRVVGNLPYNISTPLIFHLLSQISEISDMIFMVQKEVAIRLAAEAGSRLYGRLSVMASLDLQCECLFDVPPEAFDPPPRVDSTVIRLTPKLTVSPVSRKDINRVVTAAFSQRRKTLRNSLGGILSVEEIQEAGIDPSLRAEVLSPENFIQLTRQVQLAG